MDIKIGERIKYFRTSKGLSVNRLANKSGISQSYLREMEMGNYSNPSVEVLDALCESLGISLREFFDCGTGWQDADDSLMAEIARLSPAQRESLKAFLRSIHDRE